MKNVNLNLFQVHVLKGVTDKEFVQFVGIEKRTQKPFAILYSDDMIQDLRGIISDKSPVATILGIGTSN